MRCPQCKNHVLQKSGRQTRLRIQGQVVFGQDGKCHTRCYWCKAEIEVPLKILDGTAISSETFVLPQKA